MCCCDLKVCCCVLKCVVAYFIEEHPMICPKRLHVMEVRNVEM